MSQIRKNKQAWPSATLHARPTRARNPLMFCPHAQTLQQHPTLLPPPPTPATPHRNFTPLWLHPATRNEGQVTVGRVEGRRGWMEVIFLGANLWRNNTLWTSQCIFSWWARTVCFCAPPTPPSTNINHHPSLSNYFLSSSLNPLSSIYSLTHTTVSSLYILVKLLHVNHYVNEWVNKPCYEKSSR